MIIARVPFRLSIAGGGCDLPTYCSRFGASLLTASIDKYMYVFINEPPIPDKIKLHYNQNETVGDVSEIKHDIIRECFKLYDINRPIEVTSMADFGAGTGMGSSSAFTVGLLMGLNALTNTTMSFHALAELACTVEIDILGKPIGKQDQYAVTYGGINELRIDKGGGVVVNEFDLLPHVLYELESRLLLFYTNIQRDANVVLQKEKESIAKDTSHLERIQDIGLKIKHALWNEDIDAFGDLLHEHWEVKRGITDNMSTDEIDTWYRLAVTNGALGGKLIGAGGGGLLLFCAEKSKRHHLRTTLESAGLKQIDFRFEFQGAKILI